MNKCEILNEAQKWVEKAIEDDPNVLKNLETLSKKSAGLLKNMEIQQYLSIDGLYDKVFRKDESAALKKIMDFIKSNKNKYTKDEILLFLGYASRELTFYEAKSPNHENDKKNNFKEKNDYKFDKNRGLTSKPFANLDAVLNKKEGK